METKTCSDCRETKPLSEFNKNPNGKQGVNTYCRPCGAARMRAWRAANLERARQKEADGHLLRTYGITREEYNAMLEEQDGRCALCFRLPEEAGAKKLCVDHDHSTGRVRGLLCTRCNSGLQPIEDFPGWVTRALAYLSARSDELPKAALEVLDVAVVA